MSIERYLVTPDPDYHEGFIYDTFREAQDNRPTGFSIVALVYEYSDSELIVDGRPECEHCGVRMKREAYCDTCNHVPGGDHT